MSIRLPENFKNRMTEMLGSEFDDFLKAYDESNYHGLRINPLKGSKEEISKLIKDMFTLRPVPWCSSGYYYDDNTRPGRHPYHHAGLYYIQEPSAMLVGELTGAGPNMKVLDLCAAPGGKTSHIAGLMQGEGVLVANEIVPQRAKILSQNVERMGIRNCIVTNENPDRLAASMPGYFDIIVTDVPCSGEGMFRRDEIARTEWSEANVTMCATRGQDILNAADKMLKFGGRLVYSTCTFAPLEDEIAIETFINNHPEYYIEKVKLNKSEGYSEADGFVSPGERQYTREDLELENTFRLWPHKLHGEGHFAAVLVKGKTNEDIVKKKRKTDGANDKLLDNAKKLYKEFAKDKILADLKGDFVLFGDNLYLQPKEAPGIDRLRIERNGLLLGEIKKNRFEPSHALALSLKRDEFSCSYNITDENEMIKYLCGESIPCDTKLSGWCLICFNGYTAGFGKASGGMIKNHYPKGLRIKM